MEDSLLTKTQTLRIWTNEAPKYLKFIPLAKVVLHLLRLLTLEATFQQGQVVTVV